MTSTEPAAQPVSPLQQGFLDQLSFIRRETAALTSGISGERFNRVPGPGRWSAGQVVRHLLAVGGDYVGKLDALLADARARGLRDRGDYRPSLVGGLMVRSMEPPPSRRFKAPAMWRPADTPVLSPEEELEMLDGLHDQLESLIRASDGLDLKRIRFGSPASPLLLRMNAGDALNLVLTHERRHLHQLRKIVEGAPS